MTEPGEPHHPNVKLYLGVFAALMVLTVVTVAVSYWHLPPAAAIFLGLMIATIKVSLVGAYFMHLKGERAIIYSCLGLTALCLVLLFAIPITDSSLTTDRRVKGSAPAAEAAHSEAH